MQWLVLESRMLLPGKQLFVVLGTTLQAFGLNTDLRLADQRVALSVMSEDGLLLEHFKIS